MGDPVTTTSTSTSTTTTTTTTTRTTTTTPPTTTTPGTGGCAGVSAWSSAVAYTGGQKVTYGGHLWTAKCSSPSLPLSSAGDFTDLNSQGGHRQTRLEVPQGTFVLLVMFGSR